MKVLGITVLFLICGSTLWRVGRAYGQQTLPDTCLTLNWSGFSSNPDSIYVDTCLTTHQHPVFWDKGPYEIFFDTDAIKLGYGAPDSNLEVGWEAIDTAFPAIRSLFQTIADSIGPFLLKKIEPADTSDVSSRDFLMIFENYVPNDSVMSYSNRVPGLTFNLLLHPVPASITESQSNTSMRILLFPNPVFRELNITWSNAIGGSPMELIDAMGRAVNGYSLQYNSGTIVLDLSSLPAGLYLVRLGMLQQFFIHE